MHSTITSQPHEHMTIGLIALNTFVIVTVPRKDRDVSPDAKMQMMEFSRDRAKTKGCSDLPEMRGPCQRD